MKFSRQDHGCVGWFSIEELGLSDKGENSA